MEIVGVRGVFRAVGLLRLKELTIVLAREVISWDLRYLSIFRVYIH